MHQTRNVTRNGCPKPSQQRSRMNCESEGFEGRVREGRERSERRALNGAWLAASRAEKVDVTYATEESGLRACDVGQVD